MRAIRALWARPVVTVGLFGVVTVVLTHVWAATHHGPGTLTIDETGLTGHAFRLARELRLGRLGDFLDHLLTAEPVVPATSVVVILLGFSGQNAVLLATTALTVVAAMGTTAIARRLTNERVALVAGIVALTFPQAIHAGRVYGFGPGAAAGVVLATWALLACDRGHRRAVVVVFGAAIGLMLMARAMTLGFVPAFVAAGLIVLRRDRRTAINLAGAAAALLAIAGPWWWRQWRISLGYLTDYGYGEHQQNLGDNNASLLTGPLYKLLSAIGDLGVVNSLVVIVALVVVLRRRRGRIGNWFRGPWSDADRELLGLAAVVVGSYLALSTTVNEGLNFTLPLMYLTVALGAAVVWRLGAVGRRRAAAVVLPVAVAGAVLSVVGTMPEDGPAAGAWALVDVRGNGNRAASGDPELDARWWELNQQVVAEATRLAGTGDGSTYVVIGDGTEEMNTGTFMMITLMRDRDAPAFEGLRGFETATEARPKLDPGAGGGRRVVIVVNPREKALGVPVDEARDAARELGWRTERRWDLPDGGTVEILTRR